MTTDPNSFEAIKPQLSAQALQDIEGLDPALYGFGREECCGAVPEKLPGSMNLDKEHIFLGSRMPFTEWDKRTENVSGYNSLTKKLKDKYPKASLTVCQVQGDDDECVLRFRMNTDTGLLETVQYSGGTEGEIPWDAKGALSTDRSDEYFIFICAHRSRDERCGYCGAVLVDLFRQTIAKRLDAAAAQRVTVLPCSHVGGHIYAGNVIVYSKFGGVGFGLFMPTDVEAVVDSIAEGEGKVPESLTARVRGQIGLQKKQSTCTIM